ncbi:leucyl aminopeptidase [Caldovatus aquaticus]|uniref:Probable cytosol aminopeptidase n=1 Tax=Caldovatus aquaticus TaxID=2865671 RepID=A0ABS7EZS4_9PROT|nr:leucyl aminopeptidase [Caldovatus aquaticus]MBW8268071.1 leucyl aminopeptidase [Caldovatus aquaticus]
MLKVRLHRAPPEGAALRVLPLAEGAAVPEPFRAAAAAARFTGRAGQALHCLVPERALLVGAGPAAAPLDFARAGGGAVAQADEETRALALDARGLPPEAAAALAAGACLRAWRCDRYRTKDVKPGLERLDLVVDRPHAVAPAWERAAAAVRGCLLARDLVAEPANHLTPALFAERMERLAEDGLAVEVLGPKRLAKLGFGALLAVGGGSANPPRLVVLRWKGAGGAAPVAFVGKGICFDTGGLALKPAEGMEEMRADMAGAAACAGAMLALALRRSPAPAVAVLALAENAIGAASYRPGDVLRTLSGRTVEVLDTDAEGRLVLADALHYAATRLAPRAIVDLATLTGAIVTALGHHRAGLFATDAALAAQVAAAGEAVGEPVWPMPIGERHREDLRSDIADLRQCAPHGSGAWGGRFLPDACHAAAFLRAFAEGVPWAHLDIAGVALRKEADALGPEGASGFGARLLDALVAMRFEEGKG